MGLTRRQLLGVGAGLGATVVVGGSAAELLSRRHDDDPPRTLRESATADGTRFPGDPGEGTLFYGASVMPGLSVSDLEDALDHRLTLRRTYYNATQADALVAQVDADHRAACLPVVSSKLPGTWAEGAEGGFDTWLHDLLGRLDGLSGPTMLSLHHEPENDAGGEGMDPSDWVGLQQRAIAAAQGSSVTILPVLMGWTFISDSGRDPSQWWVEGAPVMGIDSYNNWAPSNGLPWTSFEDGIAPARSYAGDVPLLVAEYGCRTPTGDAASLAYQWMVDAFEYSYAHDIVGLSYFDSSVDAPDGTWVLDDVRTRAMRYCIGQPQVVQLP